MTALTPSAAQVLSELLAEAEQIIRANAASLREGHTVDSDWGEWDEAQEAYERELGIADRLLAALSTLPAEPEGWRLVPVEPTPEMLDKGGMEIAMNQQRVMTAERKAEHVYRAMLAAVPLEPRQP